MQELTRPSAPSPAPSTPCSVEFDLSIFGTKPEDAPLPLPLPTIDSHALSPSMKLLFSLLPTRTLLLLVLPAVCFSMVAGGTAPFMTHVIGQNFDAFAAFPLSPNPPDSAKSALLLAVGLVALQLIGLAVATLALSSITSSFWIWIGEYNVKAVRQLVYETVSRKEMVWFDMKTGTEGEVQSTDDKGPLGAGGLMARFARETDDVRAASSLATGNLIQYLTTTITCLVLAFIRSPFLTLVILSAVPALMLIQGISDSFANPLQAAERQQTAVAATLIDRAIGAISTVKAFNAQSSEVSAVSSVLSRVNKTIRKLSMVWGGTHAASQFVCMGMFVQAFWFGAKLVRTGKISPGAVMAVFWACLIATTHLQMCIQQTVMLAKGKTAMSSLLTLCHSHTTLPSAPQKDSPRKLRRRATETTLRKIRPDRCAGEVSMHSISFAYPTRPNLPVLRDVSLYLPAHETTFIVGGSGSGKSTVAALLLRMYSPTSGRICIDDQDIMYLDDAWMKAHVASVSQGCTLFDGTVHENVAMGLDDEEVTRDQVIGVCRAALMHEFVRDLPDGYDTKLGNDGAALSGGQRQRLAIARALLRNPSVLILDEATSALDASSRILVFEAVKRWRRNRTTVVITHDLSQITPTDFIYVLKGGELVEQGYRADLESGHGAFKEMVDSQGQTGGFLPEKVVDGAHDRAPVGEMLAQAEDGDGEDQPQASSSGTTHPTMRPMSLANWMFEAVAKLTDPRPPSRGANPMRETLNRFLPADAFPAQAQQVPGQVVGHRRPSSVHIIIPPRALTSDSRRLSLQFSPATPTTPSSRKMSILTTSSAETLVKDDGSFEFEKDFLKRNGEKAAEVRTEKRDRTRWDADRVTIVSAQRELEVKEKEDPNQSQPEGETARQLSFWQLLVEVYPTIPYKPFLFFGLFICILSGAMTPLFSFVLSRLLFEVSTGAKHTDIINRFGGIVLGVAAADGLLLGLKYFVMETNAISWVTHLRKSAFELVLAQDKKWFDKTEHSAPSLVQLLIKDGDDARSLIAAVIGQCLVVVTMVGVGLTWALVRGWQLTLVGFAITPVFVGVMAFLTTLIGKYEARNKQARLEVAKGYYEVISNVRGIRAMGLENIFDAQFEAATERALQTGVRGAFVEGCSFGAANALIYLAEALLFYVGAILITRGTYTYLQMFEVLNLVVFTVTIGSQLMAFTQRIAKSVLATRDFNRLIKLTTDTDESRGIFKPVISGPVTLKNVSFAYPGRSDVPVLKNVSMKIANGECVAVVGSSGSGKSTVAALLQRLYEPDSGRIRFGPMDIGDIDVRYLREHVSVVSQNPNLFDATISENIAYGSKDVTDADVRNAATAANVHDFIMSLPDGYKTMVGENASLISGGQAQRLQIARALVRPSKILILDECTSALDSFNQAAIMETIRNAQGGRTTIVITHKLQVMRMCDRITVVHEGQIVETGKYDDLMALDGVFASHARGGEWNGE